MHLPIIYADLHWSETSSIVRAQGDKYTVRLHHLIDTVNNIERHAERIGSDTIILLGDTFDKAELTAQEITALQELKFNQNINHIFLVGNHEISKKSLTQSTAHLFRVFPNCQVIDTPTTVDCGNTEICFLPYIMEQDRSPIDHYFGKKEKQRLILSHNDIKGIQMGGYVSQTGFEIQDIEDNCDLFINGHIHNGQRITDKIINIGNICGQNFSEDASRFRHCYMVLDTESLSFTPYENESALNFYSMEIKNTSDFSIESALGHIGSNAVLSVKTTNRKKVQTLLSKYTNIISCRVIEDYQPVQTEECKKIEKLNHLEAFVEFVKSSIGNDATVQNELQEVLK